MYINISAQAAQTMLHQLRRQQPVVHNITNFVAMQGIANMLLACGAAPIMAHAPEEMQEISNIAAALNINIGTLDAQLLNSIDLAQRQALDKAIPIVLDPVGSGATNFRTTASKKILAAGVTVVRGNASEIISLSQTIVASKGVESSHNLDAAKPSAQQIAKQYNCVVVVSGATDYVVDAQGQEAFVTTGTAMFTKVTAMGCALSAVIAAFLAVAADPFVAAVTATKIFSEAGEVAAKQAAGPGSFYQLLIDTIYAK